MTGRHVLGKDARRETEIDPMDSYPAQLLDGGDALVSPGAEISDDTHVGVDMETLPHHPEVRRSASNPDALVEHGVVGDGTELE